jgi:hypothetical protein
MIADWHFFAKYVFILENEAQQFQIKIFRISTFDD